MKSQAIHEAVGRFYARAARDGAERDVDTIEDERWGTSNYDANSLGEVPEEAAELSMGCGNPYVLADLKNGDIVLDLGSGGGIDVILSARRVAPDGLAYGIDMLQEMVDIAEANAAKAGVENVRFLRGLMEDVPLPDASVDVVISNCVICLAPEKPAVFAETFRVLKPGGRIALSDVVAPAGRSEAKPTLDDLDSWVECGEGALPADVYQRLLEEAGFAEVTVELTHDVGDDRRSAMIRGRRP